jgi:hypothetical protein
MVITLACRACEGGSIPLISAMKKPFLLIAGFGYYPSSGTGDWIKAFETYELAKSQIEEKVIHKETRIIYLPDGATYDWYQIVDLRDWAD